MVKIKEAKSEKPAQNTKKASSATKEVIRTSDWWKYSEGFSKMYDNEYDNEFI